MEVSQPLTFLLFFPLHKTLMVWYNFDINVVTSSYFKGDGNAINHKI